MHPVLFNLGPLEIRVYGLVVAIGFLTAIYFAAFLAERQGIKKDIIYDLGFVIIISSIIGARLLYIFVWYKYFLKNFLEIFMVWKGGMVFYGGLIGALIGSFIYIKIKKLPFLKIGDLSMPFVSLAHSIGRIGCFYNGCCYGRIDEKCGIIFPAIGDGQPHLPTQIYESILNLINFLLLIILYKYFKKREGLIFYLYFINYSFIRIIMELFRGDEERGKILFFSTSTFISIILMAIGIAGLLYVFRKKFFNKNIY